MCAYEKLASLSIELPKASPRGGLYVPLKHFGEKLVYASGKGPDFDGDTFKKGKLGKDLTVDEGKEAARRCALNILATIHEDIGDLNKVKSIVKILAFVACDSEFYDQPKVVNGASELLEAVFGATAGIGARSAIGTNALPGNIPVEVELLFELK